MDGKQFIFPKDNRDESQKLNREEMKKIIIKLSDELFIKLKERIVKNILLKSYNFFLVPM